MNALSQIYCALRLILGSLPGDFDTTINPGGPFGGINGIDDGGNGGIDLGLPSGGGIGGLGGGGGGSDISDNNIDTGSDDNVNCDYLGTCYDGKSRLFRD